MEITYSYNYARFSPRPRLVDSANPYISNMNVGDIGSPDEAIGAEADRSRNDLRDESLAKTCACGRQPAEALE